MLLFDDTLLFPWLDEIWKVCFGFGFPEKDILLLDGWILFWLLIWNTCLGFVFPSNDILLLDCDTPWWLDDICKFCLGLCIPEKVILLLVLVLWLELIWKFCLGFGANEIPWLLGCIFEL